jgi:hypothetical protein
MEMSTKLPGLQKLRYSPGSDRPYRASNAVTSDWGSGWLSR